jgi:FkbM family methyltransferase
MSGSLSTYFEEGRFGGLRSLAHRLPFKHALHVIALKVMGRNRYPLLRSIRENSQYRKAHERALQKIRASSERLAIEGELRLQATPYGRFWCPRNMDLFSPLAELEIDLYGGGNRDVREGDIVLDCGANVGVFTRHALNRGASVVIAVEPSPHNIECLQRNFSTEIEEGRVIIHPKGVWNTEDILKFTTFDNSVRDSFVRQTDDTNAISIPVTTIDRMVTELGLSRVDFIKMDIEGAEQNALVGGAKTLAAFHPRMSLASYHLVEDCDRLPVLARAAWPGYTVEAGLLKSTFGHVQPEVLYFY